MIKLFVALALAFVLSTNLYAQTAGPQPIASGATFEVGFAKRGQDPSAENLVLKVIGSAKTSIRMEAYNFTDPSVIAALVAAKKRGVDVQIVHDHVAASEKGDGTSAMLAAGIPIRLLSFFKIMHDKVILVDGNISEFGSFNYSVNAQKENAENVFVIAGEPNVYNTYLSMWRTLWALGLEPGAVTTKAKG